MTPEPSYREIPLTQGQFAKVNLEDFETISRYQWHALWDSYAQRFYAGRKSPSKDKRKQITVRMHREICGLRSGDKSQVDHKNHDGLDNRRENLRICNRSQQRANAHMNRNNKCGFKGVMQVQSSGRWSSHIWHKGKQLSLGTFDTPQQAHEAYCEAAKTLKGEFACFR